jgi:hypothetical protein
VKRFESLRRWLAFAAILLLCSPQPLFACATCFGASDSDLARGMNWGILSLLSVVVVVLTGVASFFIYLVKKSAAVSARAQGRETSKGT